MFNLNAAAIVFAAALAAGCQGEDAAPAPVGEGVLGAYTSDAAGFDTHSFYYDTGREVIVFDAQFTADLGREVVQRIQAETGSPIRYVVITHPNPDKFNGVEAFREVGAQVVASEATAAAIPGVHAYKKYYFVNVAQMFTEETYPAEATVDITFSGRLSLPLEGGAQLELIELEHAGVSSTQTVAHLPASNALVVGDLVHHRAHAWLEGGIVDGAPRPDLASWSAALEELRAFEGATVYGGRGESGPVEEAVDAQQAYLSGMEALVTDYVDGLGDRKAELFNEQAGAHYKSIADVAAAAYPDYALPYMIEYGVYGLAQQIAAE
jgi:glyoxylase-like metal-dependent hydrolase (beta-lactamase superfamily II)